MLKIADDKLNRDAFLEKLFSLFKNFGDQCDRGFTMIINGKYGSGKSTLLGFLEEKNEIDHDFHIVKYNAWENNLFENPMVPILYEIGKLENNTSKIKSGAKQIIKCLPKIFVGTLANVHGVDLTSLTSNENIFDEYDTYKDALYKFRKILTDYCKDRKVLFLIDELDRCLPEYQIKVLESIYHLLEIPNLIIVIALDKEQLECAIKSKFGDVQNTLGYLSKFINYQVDLPDEEDVRFLQSLMTFRCEEEELVKPLLTKILKIMKYSIRDSQLIINQINLVCNELDISGRRKNFFFWYPLLVAIIIIIKHEDNKLYKEYFYSQKVDYFGNETIRLNESSYYVFLEKIGGTKIESIFNYLRSPDRNLSIARYFLLNFINAFYPAQFIDYTNLKDHCGIAEENIKTALGYNAMRYPQSINATINKIKEL